MNDYEFEPDFSDLEEVCETLENELERLGPLADEREFPSAEVRHHG